MKKEKIIIIGGGFGGMTVAKELDEDKFDVTLIDKTNHHLFQPLLYQVATAALSPGDIASPLRAIVSHKKNVKVFLGEVTYIDPVNKSVTLENREFYYDKLIVATGTRHSYFGNEMWEKYARGLKTLDDALKIREMILLSLEEAEKTDTPAERDKLLTYVIIGGGTTGVEMAGAIAEIAKRTVIRDFRNIDPSSTKIILIHAHDRILNSYSGNLSNSAKDILTRMGVHIRFGSRITNISSEGVFVGEEFIPTKNIIWAAGNIASPLMKSLNTELDRAGRVMVTGSLSLKNNNNIYVVGDTANFIDGNGNSLPQVAQVALQQAKYLARNLNSGNVKGIFKYIDKGSMSTIGRASAVARIKGFEFTGFFAWLLWSMVHVLFLITYRNRLKVISEWIFFYFTSRQGVRLITHSEQIIRLRRL